MEASSQAVDQMLEDYKKLFVTIYPEINDNLLSLCLLISILGTKIAVEKYPLNAKDHAAFLADVLIESIESLRNSSKSTDVQ